jgi:hypothetical protein
MPLHTVNKVDTVFAVMTGFDVDLESSGKF